MRQLKSIEIDSLDQNHCAKYFWIRLQSGQDSAGVMQRKYFDKIPPYFAAQNCKRLAHKNITSRTGNLFLCSTAN
jgi:hypothetical protein